MNQDIQKKKKNTSEPIISSYLNNHIRIHEPEYIQSPILYDLFVWFSCSTSTEIRISTQSLVLVKSQTLTKPIINKLKFSKLYENGPLNRSVLFVKISFRLSFHSQFSVFISVFKVFNIVFFQIFRRMKKNGKKFFLKKNCLMTFAEPGSFRRSFLKMSFRKQDAKHELLSVLFSLSIPILIIESIPGLAMSTTEKKKKKEKPFKSVGVLFVKFN